MLMAELLHETKPELFAAAVFSRVQSLLPRAELISKPETDIALIAHPDHMIQCKDGALPAQTAIAPAEFPLKKDRLEPELDQTFEWKEAQEAIDKAIASLCVTEFIARSLAYKTRLGIFQKVLLAATEVTRPLAIRWHRMIPPAELLSASGSAKTFGDRAFTLPQQVVEDGEIAPCLSQERVAATQGHTRRLDARSHAGGNGISPPSTRSHSPRVSNITSLRNGNSADGPSDSAHAFPLSKSASLITAIRTDCSDGSGNQ